MSIVDNLTGDIWEAATDAQRARLAHDLSRHLGPLWQFVGIETHTQDSQTRHTALWERAGARFSLIPSAEVTLGYDRARPRAMTDDEMRAWWQTSFFQDVRAIDEDEEDLPSVEEIARLMNEHAIPSMADYLDGCTSPLRCVTIAPFLIETHTTDITEFPISGQPRVRRVRPISHREVHERLSQTEFRLPTSDEWEYACSAGACTLFHWGETCPLDRYPLIGYGSLGVMLQFRSAETDALNWYPDDSRNSSKSGIAHLETNVFGLHIAECPYCWEMCAEPNIMRGGDGGGSICGGDGYILGWLPLASAFVANRENDERPIFGVHLRRVRPLF